MPKIRRKFFVSKRLQGFFALYLSLTIVVMSLFLGMEFLRSYFAVFGWQLGGGGSLKIPLVSEGSPFAAPFAEIDVLSLIKVVLLLLWGALCVGISYVLAANKFSGPLVRLNINLRKMASGDYTLRTRFRSRDEAFHSIADGFNMLMDGVQKRIEKDLNILNQFEQKLSVISREVPSGSAAQKAAQEMSAAVQNLKAEKAKLITQPEPKPAGAKA